MNITLALVLGAAGAILILVAAIGGGFTIAAITMPRVGVFPRMISFVLGGALVVFALAVYDWDTVSASPSIDASPTGQQVQVPTPSSPTPDPVTARIVAPDGYTISLFTGVNSSASIVADLPAGQSVTIICTMQGESVSSGINGYTSSLWDGVSVGTGNTVGFVPDVYVGTPTYQPTMPNCQDLWNSDTSRT
jgi:hypothetical protein